MRVNPIWGSEQVWKDAFESMEELKAWSETHELRYMVHAKNNALFEEATMKILLWKMPSWMRGFGKMVFALLRLWRRTLLW